MLRDFLITNGWKNYPAMNKLPPETIKELWMKPNPGTPALNLDYTQMNIHGVLTDFVTVQLIGEHDGFWHDISIYSLSPQDFMREDAKIIDSLTKSWRAFYDNNIQKQR